MIVVVVVVVVMSDRRQQEQRFRRESPRPVVTSRGASNGLGGRVRAQTLCRCASPSEKPLSRHNRELADPSRFLKAWRQVGWLGHTERLPIQFPAIWF